MAFSFQVGPPVLGLAGPGAGCGAGAVAGAGAQSRPGARAGGGTEVGPGFGARAWTDATPGAGAGVWAGEPRVCVQIGFIDVTVRRLSVFKGVSADPRTAHGVLLHSICT